MIWLALLSAAIWVYLLGCHGRFWQAGPMLTPASPRVAADVAIGLRLAREIIGNARRTRSCRYHQRK